MAIIVFNLVEIPLLFIYFIYLPSKSGQTFGKKMVGIKVVNEQGKIPSISQFLLRETIGRFISVMFFSLGYLWILWDKKRQA